MTTVDSLRTVTRVSTALLLAIFCGVVGLIQDNRVLLAMFESFAGLLLLSWVYVRWAGRGLEAERIVATRASEGDVLEVTVRVRHRGWLPLFHLEVRDWFAADFIPLKRTLIPFLPPDGDWVDVTYLGRCDQGRGRFEAGPLELFVSDPMGFFRRTIVIGIRSEIVVYPGTVPVQALRLQESQNRAPVSSISEGAFAGQAATFYGTREYRPGDNMRHIHWPSTARWGRLILKEFESDSELELTIFFDTSRASIRGLGRGGTVETAIRIAASLADFSIRRLHGCRVICDPGSPVVLHPKPGPAQRLAVMETLALVKPMGTTPFPQLVGQAVPLVPEGSAVVLIFSGTDSDAGAWIDILGRFSRRGVQILPIVLDASSFRAMDAANDAGSVARLVALLESLGLPPRIVRAGDDLAALFALKVIP